VAEQGDRAAALRLLSKGASPNVAGPDGTTPIMWAASNDDVELVRALIKAGADVKVKNQLGTSRCRGRHHRLRAIIEALLKAGADANSRNPEGETPLMAVARSGNVDAAKRLLAAGADVNAKRVRRAIRRDVGGGAKPGRDGEVLATHGADVNARGRHPSVERKIITEPRPKDMNKGGFTPLLYARARAVSSAPET